MGKTLINVSACYHATITPRTLEYVQTVSAYTPLPFSCLLLMMMIVMACKRDKFTIEQNCLKRGSTEYTSFSYSTHIYIPSSFPSQSDFLLHLVIREFVSVSIADFASTKSMGKVNDHA